MRLKIFFEVTHLMNLGGLTKVSNENPVRSVPTENVAYVEAKGEDAGAYFENNVVRNVARSNTRSNKGGFRRPGKNRKSLVSGDGGGGG